MVADSTEEEQIEALKRWLAENGISLVVGIVLALGAVFGYRAWENSVRQTGEEASAIYQDLVAAVTPIPGVESSPEMIATGKSLAEQLRNNHGDSSYALFAALTVAKVAVDAGNLAKAANELNWVLANGAEGSVGILARIRLARVLLAQELDEEALALLEPELELLAHHSAWQEIKGDIYLSMDRIDEARQAYQLAVNSVGQVGSRPYLNMKLEDLMIARQESTTEEVVEEVLDEAEISAEEEKEG